MNWRQLLLACFVFGAALGVGSPGIALADTRETPYAIIPQRNAFGLKEIPPPVPPNTNPPPAPPALVKLTGITTILSKALALLEYTEPGKLVQKPTLSAGERDGPIEVLAIDARAGTVKIRNANLESVLTFEKDGIKPPTVAAAPVPGAPGLPSPGHPPPGVPIPPPSPGSGYNATKPGTPAYPTTRLNSGAVLSGGTPQPGGVTPNIQFSTPGGLQTIPTRPTRLPTGQEIQPEAASAGLTANQKQDMIEVNKVLSDELYRQGKHIDPATGKLIMPPSGVMPPDLRPLNNSIKAIYNVKP